MRSTPAVAASRARSKCVDMSTCSPFPSIANRDCFPLDTGNSNVKCPPRVCVASAMRTQFVTRRWLALLSPGVPALAVVPPLGARWCGGLMGLLARNAPRTMSNTAATQIRRRT
eukprot:3689740-Pleurochrysis_carterae.AAC.1